MLKKNSYRRKTYRRKTYKKKTYKRKNGGNLVRAFSPVTKSLIPAGKIVAKGTIDGTTRVVGDVGMNLTQQAFNKTISDKNTINPLFYNFQKNPYRNIDYYNSPSLPTTSDYDIKQKIPRDPFFPYKGFIPPEETIVPHYE
jgi:hypothetical protein